MQKIDLEAYLQYWWQWQNIKVFLWVDSITPTTLPKKKKDNPIEKYMTRGTWISISQKSVSEWPINVRCSDLLVTREIQIRVTIYPSTAN